MKMEKCNYKYLFFDLDGTLIDSIKDITYALNKMREHFGLYPICDRITASIIGEGFPVTVRKVLALDLPQEKINIFYKDALKITLNSYDISIGKYTKVYSGVVEFLKYFKENLHLKSAIVTNKEEVQTIKILRYLNILQYFDSIVGGDTTEFYKPNPAPLMHAKKLLGINSPIDDKTSLMIGDSETDAKCAEACNMSYILINHGYSKGINLHELNAIAVIPHFKELKKYILKQ